jgi:hypothetical protein
MWGGGEHRSVGISFTYTEADYDPPARPPDWR